MPGRKKLQDIIQYIDKVDESGFNLFTLTRDDITRLKEFVDHGAGDPKIPLAVVNKLFEELLFRRDLLSLKNVIDFCAFDRLMRSWACWRSRLRMIKRTPFRK